MVNKEVLELKVRKLTEKLLRDYNKYDRKSNEQLNAYCYGENLRGEKTLERLREVCDQLVYIRKNFPECKDIFENSDF